MTVTLTFGGGHPLGQDCFRLRLAAEGDKGLPGLQIRGYVVRIDLPRAGQLGQGLLLLTGLEVFHGQGEIEKEIVRFVLQHLTYGFQTGHKHYPLNPCHPKSIVAVPMLLHTPPEGHSRLGSRALFATLPRMDTKAANKWALLWSLIGGCIVGVPLGWLLTYLAFLPVFLGLFFFMLLGLIPGALMYRLGSPAAPVRRGMLWLLGLGVSLLIGITGLVAEYRDLENNVAQTIEGKYRRGLPADQRQQIRSTVRAYLVDFLKKDYPPGGFPGYLHWAAVNGTLECSVDLDRPVSFTYRLTQRKGIWLTRVILSFILLAGAVLSQVLGLAKKRDPKESEGTGSPSPPGAPRNPDCPDRSSDL